ncbi:hypothetical protein NMG60_11029992 [Bertholletia excelsa]
MKKKAMIRAQWGQNHDGQASSDNILPGLHDDMALNILAWCTMSDYSNLACLNKRFNSLMASDNIYKLGQRLGVVEHLVCVACILMPWEAFNRVGQKWMRLPKIPCDEYFTYANMESLAVGTELLVFGHKILGFAIWMYSLVTRTWARCPPMNLPRCLFGSGSLREIATIAGEVSNYRWNLGDFADLFGWKFYVFGGITNNFEFLTCGEEYNIEQRTWRRIKNMYSVSFTNNDSIAGRSPPLVAVVNNQLYCADQVTNEVKKYDKINNSWSVVTRLPIRADSSNSWGLGNKLLVIGRHRGPGGEPIVLHSWQPDDGGNAWQVLSVSETRSSFVTRLL